MHDRELWRVEKATAVQPVRGNEVSPILLAISEVEADIGSTKAAIGSRHFSVRLCNALSGMSRHVDYNAGLVAVLGRRSSSDDFHGLNRIERNLIGKHFALLVSDWLTINGERVLSMIAQTMEQAIRMSNDPRRRQSQQRTDPGGLALQGNLVKQSAVHIGMEVRIVLYEVASRLGPSRRF